VALVAIVAVRTATLPAGALVQSLSTMGTTHVDNSAVIPQL
jgi:hypothetical protein